MICSSKFITILKNHKSSAMNYDDYIYLVGGFEPDMGVFSTIERLIEYGVLERTYGMMGDLIHLCLNYSFDINKAFDSLDGLTFRSWAECKAVLIEVRFKYLTDLPPGVGPESLYEMLCEHGWILIDGRSITIRKP